MVCGANSDLFGWPVARVAQAKAFETWAIYWFCGATVLDVVVAALLLWRLWCVAVGEVPTTSLWRWGRRCGAAWWAREHPPFAWSSYVPSELCESCVGAGAVGGRRK
ncbi:hypothetical protein LTR28_008542 [Elasticomyces elasticus]|nr:hypothetical protein LTR28_008542 [Elasticomyces elasticus]